MGEFLEECKHFFCSLDLGGTSEVGLQHSKLLGTLSPLQILLMEERFNASPPRIETRASSTNPDALTLLNLSSLSIWASLLILPTEYLGLVSQCFVIIQNLGQSAFVTSLRSLGNLSAMEFSWSVFIDSSWLAAVALRSRAWLSDWVAKMSFKSFAREDITVLDVTVAGVDAVWKMMKALVMPSGVVAFEEGDEDDGFDKNGLEAAAAVRVVAM